MTEPLKVVVPDVVGLTSTEATKSLERVGLKVGDARLTASSETTTGNVSSTEPAGGTVVDAGTTVNLAFSSGPVRVKVPDVIGMTRSAAEAKLKSAGLAIGNDKTTPSTGATIGTVMSATPPVGALTDIGSEVRLEIADAPAKISSGPKAAGWTPQSILESIQPFVQPGLFGVLGLTVLILIVVVITQNNQDFLRELSDRDVARGLITFLIAITTVGIALILAISTLTLPEDSEGDKRFDRGKQVLTILIGVLGTIVGFYFGSAPDTTHRLTITTTILQDGTAKQAYGPVTLRASGATPPLKWSSNPPLPDGLSLSTDGTLSGTPTAALATKHFTLIVTDSAVPPATAAEDVTLTIK